MSVNNHKMSLMDLTNKTLNKAIFKNQNTSREIISTGVSMTYIFFQVLPPLLSAKILGYFLIQK